MLTLKIRHLVTVCCNASKVHGGFTLHDAIATIESRNDARNRAMFNSVRYIGGGDWATVARIVAQCENTIRC